MSKCQLPDEMQDFTISEGEEVLVAEELDVDALESLNAASRNGLEPDEFRKRLAAAGVRIDHPLFHLRDKAPGSRMSLSRFSGTPPGLKGAVTSGWMIRFITQEKGWSENSWEFVYLTIEPTSKVVLAQVQRPVGMQVPVGWTY